MKAKKSDGSVRSNGHGGVRKGAGRPASKLADMTVVREALEQMATVCDSIPFLLKLFVGDLAQMLQELARMVGRLEYQLAGHLRTMDHKLDRLQDEHERQEVREKAKEARALERAAADRAEAEALRAELAAAREQAAELKAEVLSGREQLATLTAIAEGLRTHLSRIQHSVREVPTAVPVEALTAAVRSGARDAVTAEIRNGALRVSSSPPRRPPSVGPGLVPGLPLRSPPA
ncbi:hypothetical protein VQH23_19690 [Pararoseomonas sp. SCSIO 73927]|uniref:hypothetical protein n=1 Tax=Pararoseomonas sp. SCSIO 73927 TaxID=3114537 RepID=UPI0030CE32FC